MRIVSLLPSATEMVCLIAPECLTEHADVWLVGRSHECDFPNDPRLAAIPMLTAARASHAMLPSMATVDEAVRGALASGQSLYTLDERALAALKPDVIITQDLCSVCSIELASVRRVAARIEPTPRVVSLNPTTLEDVLDDVLRVGEAIGLARRAEEVVVHLRQRIYAAEEFVNPFADRPVVAFLEWTDPIYVGGHWIPQLIERAGGEHPLNPTLAVEGAGAAAGPIGQTMRRAGKSIRVTDEAVVAARPRFVVVSPCGVGLHETLDLVPPLVERLWGKSVGEARPQVAAVDGNQMFSRPGPRLVDGLEFLVGWLNGRPEVIPKDFPWREV